jgi:hypothetical protein
VKDDILGFAQLTPRKAVGLRVSNARPPSLSELGFRSFSTAGSMLAALRAEVMLKFIRQAHEAEMNPSAPTSIRPNPEDWSKVAWTKMIEDERKR